jgi:hypothetical protein
VITGYSAMGIFIQARRPAPLASFFGQRSQNTTQAASLVSDSRAASDDARALQGVFLVLTSDL